MDRPSFTDVAFSIINHAKAHFWFCSGSEPGMTLKKGSSIVYPISGSSVDYYILECFDRKGYLARRDFRAMVVDLWKAHAKTVGNKSPARRIFRRGGKLYYKCTNTEILRISAKGIASSESYPNVYFWNDEVEAEQVEPDLTAKPKDLIPLLRQVFRISEEHELLFAALLLAFFDPDLVSPILVLLGSRGTSKTTTSKQICSLVSPTKVNPLVAFPSKEDALLAQLTNSYIAAFDNVAFPINPRFADILCQHVTGSTYAKRKLYSDNEKLLIPLQGKSILNGIDEIASKDDFAERCCVVNLAPIPPEERMTDTQVKKRFEKVKPLLLGSIFNTLSAILANTNTFSDFKKPRMAEFFIFGLKAMEAIGENPEDFSKAYLGNVETQVADAEARLPIVQAVGELFHSREEAVIKESPTELARCLNRMAKIKDIKMVDLTPETVTKTLKKNAPALEHCGYEVIIPQERKNKRYIELKASDEIVKSFKKRSRRIIEDDLSDL